MLEVFFFFLVKSLKQSDSLEADDTMHKSCLYQISVCGVHFTRTSAKLEQAGYLAHPSSLCHIVNFLLATVMQFLIYISAMEVPELCAICKHPVDSGDHSDIQRGV